jgi:hypothetical protein
MREFVLAKTKAPELLGSGARILPGDLLG